MSMIAKYLGEDVEGQALLAMGSAVSRRIREIQAGADE